MESPRYVPCAIVWCVLVFASSCNAQKIKDNGKHDDTLEKMEQGTISLYTIEAQ